MTPAVQLLEREGVTYELLEYEHDDDPRNFGQQAADALGLPADQVFKTLLVSVAGERDPVVAIVPVSGSVAMKQVATVLGAKRATMCEPAVAERITGYVVGGISPFGQRRPLKTLLDRSAQRFSTIYVSGGRRGLDIAVDPNDLVRLLDASVAAIAT